MLSRFAARILAVVAMLGTAVPGARAQGAIHSDPDGLTVHEWGTFTSIAGPDGQAAAPPLSRLARCTSPNPIRP